MRAEYLGSIRTKTSSEIGRRETPVQEFLEQKEEHFKNLDYTVGLD